MAKSYPPYLEGTIPAFYGDSITVPFAMNRAVGKNNFTGFTLLIKSIQTGKQIEACDSFNYDLDNNIVKFNITPSKYNVGQSYKIQLAYNNSGEIGYYSTVAIAKYTTTPNIKILDNKGNQLKKSYPNKHIYQYVGQYNTNDATEKMYSCQFKVYDQNGNIIEDTGEIIHNSLNDENTNNGTYTMLETYNLTRELEEGKNYYIQFLVKTIGLMELNTDKYQITQGLSIPPDNNIFVKTYLSYDNGYIDVILESSNKSKNLYGKYILSRSSSKDNFSSWDEIMTFSVSGVPEKEIWKDFTIEHGVVYKYAVFMVDQSGNYSTKTISDPLMADFEDMFLFDGERQLKIRFDPKVSNFKNIRTESKTDTIGGKYPYIFRNGYIDYKEFSISGLISHLTDSDGYFEKALAQTKYDSSGSLSIGGLYSTDLNSENFIMERQFKLKVLDWLTDGKLKLFRSPAEGNYLVRLMNVALTSIDSLGRMLHSFNCNATEVKDYTHTNLIESGIIKDNLLIGLDALNRIESNRIPLSHLTLNNYLEEKNLHNIIGVSFEGVSGSPRVEINGNEVNISLSPNFQNTPIYSLKGISGQNYSSGYFSLYYKSNTAPNISSTISGVNSIDVPTIQLYGRDNLYNNVKSSPKNLLTSFLASQGKEYLSQIFSVKFIQRPVQRVQITGNDWTKLKNYNNLNSSITENAITLYEVFQDGIFLGYKDRGYKLLAEDWSFNGKTKIVTFENAKTGMQTKYQIDNELILDSSQVDFGSLSGIYADLFLIVEFCCRIGSYDFTKVTNGSPLDIYLQAVESFQNGDYDDQSKLDQLLSTINNFLGGIL